MPGVSTDERPEAYGYRRHLARLFGVRLVSDLYEKACDLGLKPPLDRKRQERLSCIDKAGALFIHVPKNAGMSVSQALYGQQIKHATVRYYQTVAPELKARTPSFALIRDPVQRFVSAFRYAQAGGASHNAVSLPFRAAYRAFREVDEALDHIEGAASPYHFDHIFRPQAWYVTGRDGAVAVDRLLPLQTLDVIGDMIPALRGRDIPRLNGGGACDGKGLSCVQLDRLKRLYARDFELFERVRMEADR